MTAGKFATKLMVIALAAMISAFALVGTAFAAPAVEGADSHSTGSALESGEIDVATVTGQKGDTVFVSVSVKDRGEVAKYIPYTLGEGNVKGEGNNWTGVVSLDVGSLDASLLDGSYVITIHASRAGGDPLYQGAIYGVYADLPDGTSKLIGTRTVGSADDASRAFVADDTLYVDGVSYRLASAKPAEEDGALHFTYEAYDEATSVDGVIKYVDKSGAVIATSKIPGLANGEERTVSIPTAVTASNGDVYRTVFFKDSVKAANPGATSFTIPCTKMSDADKTASNYYVATIQLVDESGHVIASDSVNVTGTYRYTAPSTIYKTETTGSEQSVAAYDLADDPVVLLDAASDGVKSGSKVVQVHYAKQAAEKDEVSVTFNLIDGTKRVNDPDRILGTKTVVVNDGNPTAAPDAQTEKDGAVYKLAGDPSDYAYSQKSGKTPVVNAYYTPEGYEAPGPYEVKVEYVNFSTGETIASETYKSDPATMLEIETPAGFSQDGVDYVRLDGQEEPISHSYYSGIASYTVYYRDKTDVLTSGTVINTIRVVYVDGGTTQSGATTPGAAGADAASADDGSNAAAFQLNAGRTYNVLDGEGNNSTMTNESGIDTNTERIEEEETPLASGLDAAGKSNSEQADGTFFGLPLPLGVAAATAAVAVLAIVALRRCRNDDEKEA